MDSTDPRTWEGVGIGRQSDGFTFYPAYMGAETDLGTDTFVPSHIVGRMPSIKGAPGVEVILAVRNGVPEVIKLTLESTEDGRGVRTSDLRQWLLEAFATRVFEMFGRRHRFGQDDSPLGATLPRDEAERWQISGDIVRAQAGRPANSDAELRQVAEIYSAAIAGSPTRAVAFQLGYSQRTAARRVRQARDRGFLPGTTQGRKHADGQMA